jgi:hypothetical protein
MKALFTALLLLVASFAYAAVSLDDIVKLSKLKTSDEVILKLVQKEGLNKPVTSKDVVFLKQQGVSDRVIQYLVKLSDTEAQKLPPQQGKSVYIDENMRAYYTTTKSGKRIRVVTNLDESGKRMGGELPPDPEPPQEQPMARYERPPQEIRVVVEDPRREEDYAEPEYPEYVDDRYVMPGYPLYSPYFSTPYYPYYPKQHHNKGHRFFDPNQPNWNYDYRKNHPAQRPMQRPSHPNKIQPSKPQGAKTFRSFKG